MVGRGLKNAELDLLGAQIVRVHQFRGRNGAHGWRGGNVNILTVVPVFTTYGMGYG
jgi:hypothetical protein